jgi:L-asparaginase II
LTPAPPIPFETNPGGESVSLASPSQDNFGYQPLYAVYRGNTIESLHYGAAAVVKPNGELFAWIGDPQTVTFLRSSAKPFQTIPLVEKGGLERFQITSQELAVTCASHSGTDLHLKTIYQLQQKIGISESDLKCCTHPPFDAATRSKLQDQGISPSPNHHNCSGKHTGMLAQTVLLGVAKENYTEVENPVQQGILKTFSDMCGLRSACFSDLHVRTRFRPY